MTVSLKSLQKISLFLFSKKRDSEKVDQNFNMKLKTQKSHNYMSIKKFPKLNTSNIGLCHKTSTVHFFFRYPYFFFFYNFQHFNSFTRFYIFLYGVCEKYNNINHWLFKYAKFGIPGYFTFTLKHNSTNKALQDVNR